MSERPVILLAEDDTSHRLMLHTMLAEWGYDVREAANGAEAIACCGEINPDLALVDVRMPVKSGFEAIPELLALAPSLPIVLMTAFSDLEMAVQAMRLGAWDYVPKPLDMTKLRETLRHALKNRSGEAGGAEESGMTSNFPLLGNSAAMRKLEQLVYSVAPSEATVLITGESGTGKELAARAIHGASKRGGGPFMAINCGAFSESLLASELFGHERGAFTGADKKHDGIFVRARGGTLFLDEVGETPLPMQVKLLRVLQEREVLSVGGTTPIPVDCRIVAATNRDLASEVKKGSFREDLYYRLNVVGITMPPLRDRDGDIPLLAEHFAKRFAARNGKRLLGITPSAMACLKEWHWPGNVRELENVLERAVILMPGEYIGERELPNHIARSGREQEAVSRRPRKDDTPLPTLEEVERQVIMETLRSLNNNKTEAAKALGITRKTLHAKLNRYRENGGETA